MPPNEQNAHSRTFLCTRCENISQTHSEAYRHYTEAHIPLGVRSYFATLERAMKEKNK